MDYGYEKQEILNEISEYQNGFMGYALLGMKELNKNDLAPNGWNSVIPMPSQMEMYRLNRLQHNYIQPPFAI